MAARPMKRGIPTAHTELLYELGKQLLGDQFEEMKEMVKAEEFGNLKPGELEKIKTPAELFQKLQHKNIIRVGDYRKLRLLGKKLGIQDLIDLIEDAERALRKEGYQIKRDYDYAESASSVVSMETGSVPPSRNNNNTRLISTSSIDDAFPSDVPMDDVDHTRHHDDRPRYPDGRGYVLFINEFVEHAHDDGYLRVGCDKDKENIEKLCDETMKYKFDKYEDLKRPKLLKVLEDTKEKLKRGNYTKFILIICSHGLQVVQEKNNQKLTQESIFTVDGKSITEEELTGPFLGDKFKEFAGKPKVFIIQACRAPRPDSSDDMTGDQRKRAHPDGELGPPTLTRPVNADVLVSYATTKGTKAWRNEEDGSWFIYHFCNVIRQRHQKEHLMDLLVRVNDEVSKMESTEKGAKQMPCQITTLTKHIWL
ncbi:caspase-3-like [Acanthaster planci]|uniref:Caspase-3-like n=1 Tax=Acanthaster planci TaxID=133434 RepID=A0A8B7XTU6_ACAPL|nr:caspase-3-like [Acanthaster planci]XP_022084274.1 caspase-3-like [Acanthaster planci]